MDNYNPKEDADLQADLAELEGAGDADVQKSFVQQGREFNQGVRKWMGDLPKNVTIGLIDAAVNTADFFGDVGDTADKNVERKEQAAVAAGATPLKTPQQKREQEDPGSLFDDHLRGPLTEFRNYLAQGSGTADKLTQAVAQFALPATVWTRALGGVQGLSKLRAAGNIIGGESVAAASALAPDEGRVADLLDMSRTLEGRFGETMRTLTPDGSLGNAYIDYMSSREGDSEAEGRFKNVVDNLVTTAVFAGVLKSGAVAIRAGRRALTAPPPAMIEPGAVAPSAPNVPELGAANDTGQLEMTAYHGSPHKFDKFELSERTVGTGEGAQAYGYGIYLAESPDVAKTYAVKGQQGIGSISKYHGQELPEAAWDEIGPIMRKHNLPGDILPNQTEAGMVRGLLDNHGAALSEAEKSVLEKYALSKGSVYAVDVPDEAVAKMLDRDKILSEQPESVQTALGPEWKAFIEERKANGITQEPTGEDFYVHLWEQQAARADEAGDTKRADQAISERLMSLGIPGMRYLDEGSRPPNATMARLQGLVDKHGGDTEKALDQFMRSVYETPKEKAKIREALARDLKKPTRNLVVFDDKLTRIQGADTGAAPVAPKGWETADTGIELIPDGIFKRDDPMFAPGNEKRSNTTHWLNRIKAEVRQGNGLYQPGDIGEVEKLISKLESEMAEIPVVYNKGAKDAVALFRYSVEGVKTRRGLSSGAVLSDAGDVAGKAVRPDDIALNEKFFDAPPARQIHALLHEMSHAVSVRKIANAEPEQQVVLNHIREAVRKTGKENNRHSMTDLYGALNNQELYAEAWSNLKFRQALKDTKMPDGGTAWDAFLETTGKLLGISSLALVASIVEQGGNEGEGT